MDVFREYIKRFDDTVEDKAEPTIIERSFSFNKYLFGFQQAFINDPSKLKAALCGRRAGKTYAICYYLIQEAFRAPNSICAYIGLSRISAKRLMWRALKQANREFSLDMKFNNAELVVTLANHSQIILAGANDEGDIDKLRGSAYRLVALDECASFGPHIDALVEEVIEPALLDYDGTLALIGTPNAACRGLFYRATTNKEYGYSNHHWTVLNNPHIPDAEAWLARRMKTHGWSKENPIYLREWMGRWIRSDDSLVYKYRPGRNTFDVLPTGDYDFNYILGLDLGFEDATAFVVCAYAEDRPELYVVEAHKESHMIPSQIAMKTREYMEAYNIEIAVADTGGLGKSIVEEFRQRYNLPIRPAEKSKKGSYIEMMNSDFQRGLIKVGKHSPIVDEWELLQWQEDRKKEDPRYENHLSDACLYAWRESRHYRYEGETIAPPEYGTAAWAKAEEDRMFQQAVKSLDKEESPWWGKQNLFN